MPAGPPKYRLSLLGPPTLFQAGKAQAIKSRKAQAVLALLATRTEPCPRTRLSGLLWENLPESRAKANLRHTLHGLNKRFPGLLEQTETAVALVSSVQTDLEGEGDGSQGPFCEGLEIRDCPNFESWLEGQRGRWRDRVVERTLSQADSNPDSADALEAAHRALRLDPLCERAHALVIRLLRERGDLAAARRQWDLCLRATLQELGTVPSLISCWGPALSESAPCRIYLLGEPKLVMNGAITSLPYQKTTALLAYLAIQGEACERDELRSLLWPDARANQAAANLRHALHFLRKVLGQVLCSHGETVWLDRARVWLDCDWLCSQGEAFHSVGLFCEGLTLPDCPHFEGWLSKQRSRFRAASQEAPAPVPETPEPEGNLPAGLTPLIGGDSAIADALSQLRSSRLLTIIGPAGVGKSRTALEVARKLDLPVGWMVELASIFEPEHLLTRVASVLGIDESPGQDLAKLLERRLNAKPTLLLMDNCEHLITAVAELVSGLLRQCPELKVVATSRELLRVPGETVLALDPLPYPPADCKDLEELRRYPSVELFLTRARAVSPRFQLTPEAAPEVVSICRRLDGLPLALELAAGRTRALSLRQIAQGLKNRFRLLRGGPRTMPQRQRTLEAALAWSYELLEEQERNLFRSLAIFADSFDLEAASSVCQAEEDDEDILEQLIALLDRSLLVCREGPYGFRYAMLETIRDFAYRELERQGEVEQLQERHFRFFLERASARPAPGMEGLLELEQEHGNFSHCLDWALTASPEQALALASSLGDYWFYRGHFIEGADYLEQALEEGECASAHLWSGRHQQALGDYSKALTRFERSAELAEVPTDKARALNARAQAGFSQGDYLGSVPFAEEALKLWKEAGDKRGVVDTLSILASADICLGRWEAADERLQQVSRRCRKLGYRWGESNALYLNGLSLLFRGDFESAQGSLTRSLELCRELGSAPRMAACLGNLALSALARNQLESAQGLIEEGQGHAVASGYLQVEAFLLYVGGFLALKQGQNRAATEYLLDSLRILHRIGVKESSELVLLLLAYSTGDESLGAAALQFKAANHSVLPAYLNGLEPAFEGPELELGAAVERALG